MVGAIAILFAPLPETYSLATQRNSCHSEPQRARLGLDYEARPGGARPMGV
jgi:hypothetical protein